MIELLINTANNEKITWGVFNKMNDYEKSFIERRTMFSEIDALKSQNEDLILENGILLGKLHSFTVLVKEFLNSEMTKQEFLVKINDGKSLPAFPVG